LGSWNSSPHPISDLRDWVQDRRLEIQPDFQRRQVWTQAARIMLIDTILRGVPMPKIFTWNEIVGGSTHRRVIDGQQRIGAILGFLRDEFALDHPYDGPHAGLRFSQLPAAEQTRFLRYQIDFNEALEFDEAEVREVYSRVNKYSLPLNKQELRRADFPGRFLHLADELSVNEYLDEQRVFTVAQRRRMGDVEFTAELLAGLVEGAQDKKGDLDYFFERYAEWAPAEVDRTRSEFLGALAEIRRIFPDNELPLRTTRFKQKSDFYSLFLTVADFHRGGFTGEGKDLSCLRQDMRLLDRYIAPQSPVAILSEYAIKCVSQANSIASRAWRRDLLTMLLNGTFRHRPPFAQDLERFTELFEQLQEQDPAGLFDHCVICKEAPASHQTPDRVLAWPEGTTTFQLSNAGWAVGACRAAGAGNSP
jgi:hypothetical protein